jgi:virginiamycin A acetyltransferase
MRTKYGDIRIGVCLRWPLRMTGMEGRMGMDDGVEAGAPDPMCLHPMPGHPRAVFLRPLVTSPFTEVGEYSYYDDPGERKAFEQENVLYHYGPERLLIGRYCAFAAEVRFIMSKANHRMSGVSTYPFPIFGGGWAGAMDLITDIPSRGDTVVGNDVWIGYDSIVMPGVTIGDGAVIATGSVVVSDIPAYAIAGGNPARVIKMRYTPAEIERLLRIAWWNWPPEQVTRHVRILMDDDVDALEQAASGGDPHA